MNKSSIPKDVLCALFVIYRKGCIYFFIFDCLRINNEENYLLTCTEVLFLTDKGRIAKMT